MPRVQFFHDGPDRLPPWNSRYHGPFEAVRVMGRTLEVLRDGIWWRFARCFHLENDRVYWRIDKEKDCPIFISEDDQPGREWEGINIIP
jgi:hypothetical protein